MACFKTRNILLMAIVGWQTVNAVYFMAEPDKWRCFKDTVVNNYVSTLDLTYFADPGNGGSGLR